MARWTCDPGYLARVTEQVTDSVMLRRDAEMQWLWGAETESPIEHEMLLGLYAAAASDYGFGLRVIRYGDGGSSRWADGAVQLVGDCRSIHFFDLSARHSTSRLSVALQCRVGDYRADMVCSWESPDAGGPGIRATTAWVAVECDGYEFHDRNPEQAQRDKTRDRAFQLSGLPVLRFTGREIHRDALKCAVSVVEHLRAADFRHAPKPSAERP